MSYPFVQVIKKYDEALNQADSRKNKLLVQIAQECFTFCIFNQDLNKFLSIESIKFDPNIRPKEISISLKQFYTEHAWLSKFFHCTKILLESNKSTLIPAPLFEDSEKFCFSSFNFQVQDEDSILFNKIQNLDTYLVYAIPEILLKAIRELFPDAVLFSHSGAFIESLLILNKNQKLRKRFFVNARNSFLDIVILDGRKLLYFNTFGYRSNEDFIYFVIFVLEQLQINPEEIELILSGTIEKNSKLFETIYKYIRDVSFQVKADTFNYSYIFNDIKCLDYINLLNFELCAL
jgi:hypothetical protein